MKAKIYYQGRIILSYASGDSREEASPPIVLSSWQYPPDPEGGDHG